MAKRNSSESYKKAVIDTDARTITEYLPKEVVNVYSLDEFLSRWNGVKGVSISIGTDDEIKPVEE
jgi:hypothetical protein